MQAFASRNRSAEAGRKAPTSRSRAGSAPAAPNHNPIWQRLALNLQAKLEVGAPGDVYEREADEVADRVVLMPDPAAPAVGDLPGERSPPRIQCLCAECEDELQRQPEEERQDDDLRLQPEEESGEDEETLQSKLEPSAAVPAVTDETESRIRGLRGGGQPLGAAERSFFEPRLGQDLSQVRVHTDTSAASTAAALRAQAFTHGRDLVFAPGRFAPKTTSGRRLLAHELAHVVQQGAGGVVRRYSDSRIYGVAPAAGEHDHRIFFDYASSRIPSSERTKLTALGTLHAGKEVKLFGRASEEGDAAENNALIARRIAVVRRALERRGVTVYDTEARLSDATGQLDYRFQRSVEVVERPAATVRDPAPEASSGQDPCSRANAGLAVGDELTACQRAFFAAWPRSLTAMVIAYGRLANPGLDPARDALLARIFTGVAPSVVLAHMRNLLIQVARAPQVMSCRSSCDAACTRGMSNSGTGTGARLSICPESYQGTPDQDDNTDGIIHESAHGTTGLAADDISYSTTRRFEFLPPGESVRNTDSYTYLALLLGEPGGGWSIGPSAPDTTPGLDPATEDPKAREAVAYMEDWLNYGAFDTGLTYPYIGRSLAAWSTGVRNDTLGRNMMEELADDFALSKPSASTHAEPEDRHRMAAIHDRFSRMYDTVYHNPVEIRGADEGRERWQSAAGLPGAGQQLSVPPSFFGQGLKGRIKFLIALLARALRDVSDAFSAKYAEAADAIRKYRGLGP